MIQVKYIIQLPGGKTVSDIMSLPGASDLINYFGIFKLYAEATKCQTSIENNTETNTTTYSYIWNTQADLDEFYVFANEVTDYAQFTATFNTLVEQSGGSLTRTEQEI
jgi:hypothetical protein